MRVFGNLIGLSALDWSLRKIETSARKRTDKVIFFCRIKLVTIGFSDAGVCGRWGGTVRVLLVHIFNGARSNDSRNTKVWGRDTVSDGGLLHELHVWTALDELKSLVLASSQALANQNDGADADKGSDCNRDDQNSDEFIDSVLKSLF